MTFHRAACLGFAVTLASIAHAQPAVVYDMGGKFDKSFNEAAYNGIERWKKDTGHNYLDFEIANEAQREQAMRRMAERGANPVIGVGFSQASSIEKVSKEFPKLQFAIIDSVVKQPNVESIVFKEHEGSFLAGALAGEMTKTQKIGFVGGMQLPLIRKFEAGFRAGVKQVNPKAEVLVAYTGTFDDEKKGVEVGQDIYGRGCDIVFHAAGLDGLGVIKAAQQADKLVIGVDSDQAHVAPKHVLTSMVKHADIAVYLAVKDVMEGKFSGGDVVLGLREGGVGLTQVAPGMAPAPVLADVEKLRVALIEGKVSAPATVDELAKFVPAEPASLGLANAVAARP